MKLRWKFNHWALGNNRGKVLYPFILLEDIYEVTTKTIKHELKHVHDVEEFGFIRFYASYVWFYLRGLFFYRNHSDAYRNIKWEVRARKVQYQALTKKEQELIKNTMDRKDYEFLKKREVL